MKIYIGLDNGVNGGIVAMDESYNIIEKITMPVFGKTKKEYDLYALSDFFKKYEHCHVILEKAQPQFRDGKKQSFKTGFGYGAVQGLMAALLIPFTIIAPKQWQKKVLAGLNTDNTKDASILFCKRQWPCEDWTATERSRKEHDGMTDAACLAYYGVITR